MENKASRRAFLKSTAAGIVGGALGVPPLRAETQAAPLRDGALTAVSRHFESRWPDGVECAWVGPDYWTNPMQDWRISDGNLELIGAGAHRNVHLLTGEIGGGAFQTSVVVSRTPNAGTGRAGFELGISGPVEDYRSRAVHGSGLVAGCSLDGRLFIGGHAATEPTAFRQGSDAVRLHLDVQPTPGGYELLLTAHDPDTEEVLGGLQTEVVYASVDGGIALLADFADAESSDAGWGDSRLRFREWRIAGDGVAENADRSFGPIFFAQHTLSRGVLKMTAQLVPVEIDSDRAVRLEIREGTAWTPVAESAIDPLARTAHFRIADWNGSRDVPYRLLYDFETSEGLETAEYGGTIRKEPVDRETLVVAGLSCQTDRGFPHVHVAEGVRYHDPDLLAFTGDQLYEGNGGYGAQRHRRNVELSTLDYLRKWYLHGWAFGELMRDRPTICMPDDHDVYQGNIWGEGGTAVETYDEHDDGGYYMPAEWVNMVQRTQTWHLPDPYDPTPIEQGITVYYTDMLYGRVSFAILEDRKWKSGPDGLAPESPGRPDHITNPGIDPSDFDVPGAVLLGARQHAFLDAWTSDWRGADVKVAVSQTLLTGVSTHHGGDMMYLVADLDSNGWPPSQRDEALRRFRKGFAFHLGGDQHLPMIVRYGIDAWDDAGYNFSVPAIATGYPRWFLPNEPLEGPGATETTGRYRDGLGNLSTVHAVANPERSFRDGVVEHLVDKSSGYGILRLNKSSGEITMEAWPILSDPRMGEGEQYDGWPKTIHMLDNDGRAAAAYLPTIVVEGVENPMIQVVDAAGGDVLYTLRIRGTSFRPKVFRDGRYTIRVGDDLSWRETLEDLDPIDQEDRETLRVRL